MKILPYSIKRRDTWDRFVRASKNGTFLLERAFMDYHSDRFTDCSLLVYDDIVTDDLDEDHGTEGLKAVLPANYVEAERTVYSHQGLTYGGLIVETEITQTEVLQAMQAVLLYYREMMQAAVVVVKPIPYIYCPFPSGEELYALQRAGARLTARAVSTTVSTAHPLRMRALRVRGAKKALAHDLFIERRSEGDWDSLHAYWEVLTDVLRTYHHTTPVHTEAEMRLLMERFPKQIRLWTVRGEGDAVVAGCVVFVTREVAHIQYIAASEEGRVMGALDLLFRHLILQAYADMAYIDFGISTEHAGRDLNEGLIFQKEGFGGRAVCYDTYTIDLDRDVLLTMSAEPKDDTPRRIAFLPLKKINASFEPELSETLLRVAKSGWYVGGAPLQAFEQHFADYLGARHCVGVGNGLEALALTLYSYKRLLHWRDGDEVIVPANTFIATLLAISNAGLTPVLCEPRLTDYLIDTERMKRLLTPRTRCVMPVHLYGRVCPMDDIMTWARENGLKVIEDAAQIHGARYQGQRAGHLGDAAAFSFYPGKNLGALGDGGCVVTDDEALARTVRMMANYGSREKYVNEIRGTNSRLDTLQAAVLDLKLTRLDADNARRRQLADIYYRLVTNPLIILPPRTKEEEENVYYVFPIRCPARDALQQYLKARGIETLIHYPIPPHKQGAYAALNGMHYPLTERIHQEILSLPVSLALTDEEVEYICRCLNEFAIDV